jgi:hypothetical protein
MHGRCWNMLWREAGWLALGLALAGCGRESATLQSAERIHTAFLTALRDNDRQQVRDLFVDDDTRDEQVHHALSEIQSEMEGVHGAFPTGGHLSDVQVMRIENRGAGKRAWSRWQYANRPVCHQADLTRTPQGWRVVAFNVTTEGCTP